jgi:DNA-binding transcriptional MerR regulator
MNEEKKYSVSNLADEIGVPRTTINDWLTRYSQYIEFKVQGKRRIYSSSTLSVLREISELRNSELSSFEIEKKLLEKHPVHGEITEKNEKAPAQDQQEEKESPESEDYALIAKKQADEIGQLINQHLINMNKKIEGIEDFSKQANASSRRWFTFTLILLLLLLITGIAGALKLENYFKQNQALHKDNQQIGSKLQAVGLELSKKENDLKKTKGEVVYLNKYSKDLKENVAKLESGLKFQQSEFEKMLEKSKAEAEKAKQKEAEIYRLRNEFAQKQLELLKKLESEARERKAKEEALQQLQKQNIDQSLTIKNLSQKVLKTESEEPVEAAKSESKQSKAE